MSTALETILDQVWKELKKEFYYPLIPKPRITTESDQLCYSSIHQITLNRDFIDRVHKQGLGYEEIFHGSLAHSLGHYCFKFFPWSLTNLLVHEYEVQALVKDLDLAEKIVGLYYDVAIDVNLISNMKNKDIAKIKKVTVNRESKLNQLILALYQDLTSYPFEVELQDSDLSSRLEKLTKIDYLDRQNITPNLKVFAGVIVDLLERNEENNPHSPWCGFSLSAFKSNEIEDALVCLASQYGPQEFKGILEAFILKNKHYHNTQEVRQEVSKGFGLERVDLGIQGDLVYYEALAKNYRLKIKKKPKSKDGSLYPYTHKEFEIGNGTQDIDWFNSYGRIMPGITKIWQKKEGERYTQAEATPHLVVAIDSSGSMTNPCENVSYAVLGGICAAREYLENGARVAVFNFSCDVKVTPFSKNRDEVYRSLLQYQGGGTYINLNLLKGLVENSNEECDLLLISDMEISNVQETITYLKSIRNTKRVTIIHIGRSGQINENNIAYYSITKLVDIPNIIVGE